MTTKIKTTLLILIFIFGLQIGLQAQDKYEFATVSIITNKASVGVGNVDAIYVTTSEKGIEKIETQWKRCNNFLLDLTPLLNHIKKMTDDGWEVITVDKEVFYLKRKRN
ncbi:MAG: hypothetical protein JNL95_11240 [Chitinophagales bacterium]|nr:hypothetical protein [Chitinophagales bacterium]